NLERAERLIRLAAARGATMVALPETFNWRGKRGEDLAAAETLGGPTLALMARLARELNIHLVAGSITEHIEARHKTYNTSGLIGPDGEPMAVYRKIHLFDIDLPGRVTTMESALRERGDEIVCVGSSIGAIGLSICYDLRFPELFRRLTFAGAKIITVPA